MPTIALSHVAAMTIKPENIRNRRETKTERKGFIFTPSISLLLQNLAEREGISENDAVAKAIEKEARKLPLLGEIPCGPPAEIPDEYVEEYKNVGDLYKVRDGDYLLRARGTSMTGNGVQDGDLILIRPQESCDSGEVAAVLIDSPLGTRATLKKVVFADNSPIVQLLPMNPEHDVIEIDTSKSQLRICGVKRGVIRAH